MHESCASSSADSPPRGNQAMQSHCTERCTRHTLTTAMMIAMPSKKVTTHTAAMDGRRQAANAAAAAIEAPVRIHPVLC